MLRIFKIQNRRINILALIVIVAFGIISTLGTNGGNGDGGVEPVRYTGLETLALITSDNAKLFGEVAFIGLTAGSFISVDAGQVVQQDQFRSMSVVNIIRLLHTSLNNINSGIDLSASVIGWIETYPSEPGLCGGSVSGSMDVNESTREFSGNILFSNWCNYGFTMNGNVEFSGTCDADTFDPTNQICDMIDYIMTFNTFTASEMGVSIAMTGTLDTTITTTGYETITNLLVRDDNASKTFKFENYVTTVTVHSPSIGYDTVEVTGNVYHPDYGFVVVSTLTPVQFMHDSLDSAPLAGVVLLTGETGAVGPTTATFTFSDGIYQIAVDTDGDENTDVTWSCSWYTDQCSMI